MGAGEAAAAGRAAGARFLRGREPARTQEDRGRRAARREVVGARRDPARDLQVHHRIIVLQAVLANQPLGDLEQPPCEPRRQRDTQSLESAREPAQVALALEQPPVVDSGYFVDAVPEEKSPVVNRDRRLGTIEVGTVQIHRHVEFRGRSVIGV
jgi:hypothetical protein